MVSLFHEGCPGVEAVKLTGSVLDQAWQPLHGWKVLHFCISGAHAHAQAGNVVGAGGHGGSVALAGAWTRMDACGSGLWQQAGRQDVVLWDWIIQIIRSLSFSEARFTLRVGRGRPPDFRIFVLFDLFDRFGLESCRHVQTIVQ